MVSLNRIPELEMNLLTLQFTKDHLQERAKIFLFPIFINYNLQCFAYNYFYYFFIIFISYYVISPAYINGNEKSGTSDVRRPFACMRRCLRRRVYFWT